MEPFPGFAHSTFNPVLLLLFAVASSTLVGLADFRSRTMAAVIAVGSCAVLVFLAGEHIPFVRGVAPAAFCFGDVGVLHIISFVLPLGTALVLRLRRVTPVV